MQQFFSSCNNSHVGLLIRELKKVNKQHLKFINRYKHLPQTHKKLLLKLFIDTKSYRQIYCLVHSSGCNKNVLKGVQIPCPGPIVHIMKKENMQWVKFFLKINVIFEHNILRIRCTLFNFCTYVLGSSSIWICVISNF